MPPRRNQNGEVVFTAGVSCRRAGPPPPIRLVEVHRLRCVSGWLLSLAVLLGGVSLGTASAADAKGKSPTPSVKDGKKKDGKKKGKKKGKKGKKKGGKK